MKSKTDRPGIYLITSPSGGQYVGSAKTIWRRCHQHRTELRNRKHKNGKLQAAWDKYGESSMVFSILLFCRIEDLIMYEQICIDAIMPRYNILLIAGSSLGAKWSDEARAKKSTMMIGRKLPAETRAAMSIARTGKVVSEETRIKISAQKGWTHSEETKAKMRGRIVSAETRDLQRINAARQKRPLGRSHSAETKQKISLKLLGRKLPVETRQKMSDARKRKSSKTRVPESQGLLI